MEARTQIAGPILLALPPATNQFHLQPCKEGDNTKAMGVWDNAVASSSSSLLTLTMGWDGVGFKDLFLSLWEGADLPITNSTVREVARRLKRPVLHCKGSLKIYSDE